MYDEADMRAAQRVNEDAARIRDRRGVRLRDGELLLQVDQRAYFNAIARNGGVRKGKHIWHDAEFRRDMQRRHPELRVRSETGRAAILVGRQPGAVGPARGRQTRFGRATLTKVYV